MPPRHDDSTDARLIPVRGAVEDAEGGSDAEFDDDVVLVDTRRKRPARPERSPRTVPPVRRPPAMREAPGPPPVTSTPSRTPQRTPTRTMPVADVRRASSPPPRAPRGGSSAAVGPPRGHRRLRRLRLGILVVLLLVVAWAGGLVWAGMAGWSKVAKVDAVPNVSDRPASGSGSNYLLVGSDSRAGMTHAEQQHLGTGSAPGQRTDSILLIHLPASGDPTLLSIPRDSYVPVRGHIKNKINAAYAIGGAPLLVDTVEQATGLRVDGFVEIGFSGFSSVVDSVGGVRMCLKAPMRDEKAHIDLPKGCQVLNGKNALGYVRARYSDPLGDLGRVQRQREFLAALFKQSATPSTLLVPWRLHALATSGGSAISAGKDDSMLEVARVFLALRTVASGHGQSLTVPVSNAGLPTPVGSAVKWDSTRARALFHALRDDTPLTVKP